jgi:SAM-dependent methyltransferase
MSTWWQGFFDLDYLKLWGGRIPAERSRREAGGLWEMCRLAEGRRVLDAPCGYGRISRELALRGAIVVGVDQSDVQIEEAERRRGDLPVSQLRYVRHDLREPFPEGEFDVALNVFSSLGYGSEEEDLAIVRTLAGAVRKGGLVVIETMHRDVIASLLGRGVKTPAAKLEDGTIVIEEPIFDVVTGRVDTCWSWYGPQGGGSKRASIRIYSATELVALMTRAGLTFVSAHLGCSPEPYRVEGPDLGGRIGLLATRA